jgi:3-oxoacyl-[acyl-carrier-protein] synthase II
MNEKTGREVVITGLGPVTPNGIGRDIFWDNIANGRSFFDTIPWAKSRGYGTIQQNEIKNFKFQEYFSEEVQAGKYNRKTVAQIGNDDKVIQFGVLATKLALDDSGLEYDKEKNNIGIFLGNANGSLQTNEYITARIIQTIMEKTTELFIQKPLLCAQGGLEKLMPLFKEEKLEEFIDLLHERFGSMYKWTPPSVMNNPTYATTAKISLMFNFHGPSLAINTACSASLDAIGHAYKIIKNSDLDVMVAGGSEAPITLQAVSAFDKVDVITKTKPKPFCIDRDGFVLAEGAGMVVLEEKQHALKRGAKIYAEVKGYAQSIDGVGHVCAINPEGIYLEEAIKESLLESGLRTDEIDYVNTHGTATKTCDIAKTKALKRIFRGQAYKFNISSTKSMTGHSISSTGAMEAILTCMAMRDGIIPPTINVENRDPECDLDCTPNCAVEKPIRTSLVISMGFGGYNTALILKR